MDSGRVQQRVEAVVASGAVLGLSLAVVEGGQLTFVTSYGATATGEEAVAITADTVFSYGSIAKTLCATMIMRLVEKEVLELDRPLVTYLPDLAFSNTDAGRRVTLRHILSHTSGLPAAGREYGPAGSGALQQVIEAEIPQYTFLAEPGQLHLYANSVFCLAGYAAEIATGMRYKTLVEQEVLAPLGMNNTTFQPSLLPAEQVALPHGEQGDKWQPVTRLPQNDAGYPSSFIYGTATDLAHLAALHLNEGRIRGRRLLSTAALEEMQREHASRYMAAAAHPLAHASSGYGLGLMTGNYRRHRVVRHGGMALSYNCFFELFPDLQRGFVLLTNAALEERLMELIVFLYDELLDLPHQGIELLPAPEPVNGAEERQKWPAYVGAFLNMEWGSVVEVRHTPSELLFVQDGVELPLICIGPGQYYALMEEDWRLPVAFIGNKQPVQHIVVGGQPYHRHTQESMAAEGECLQALSGSYRDPYNMNDDEVLHLRCAGGQLWLREGSGEEFLCEPLGGLAFRCELGFFELTEDQAGATPMLVQGKATRYWRVETHVLAT